MTLFLGIIPYKGIFSSSEFSFHGGWVSSLVLWINTLLRNHNFIISSSCPTFPQKANYFGSLLQASTVCLGSGLEGDVNIPFRDLLPMVHPNDIVFDGKTVCTQTDIVKPLTHKQKASEVMAKECCNNLGSKPFLKVKMEEYYWLIAFNYSRVSCLVNRALLKFKW